MSWRSTTEEKIGFAIYTFSGEGQYKLPLRFGDVVEIWEECSGWYRGCLRFDPSKKGIFPTSHIYLKEHVVVSKG
jgi:hypothetical protein